MKSFNLFWLTVLVLAVSATPLLPSLALLVLAKGLVLLGALSFGLLYEFWFRRNLRFVQTLDHELSHSLLSVLMGNRLVELRVHEQGSGHVSYSGRGHVLISLAPYFLRLPVLGLLLLSVLVQNPLGVSGLQALTGMVIAYNLLTVYHEARPQQSDLTQNGLAFSYLAVIALNILWWGFVFSVLLADYSVLDYLKSVFSFQGWRD